MTSARGPSGQAIASYPWWITRAEPCPPGCRTGQGEGLRRGWDEARFERNEKGFQTDSGDGVRGLEFANAQRRRLPGRSSA